MHDSLDKSTLIADQRDGELHARGQRIAALSGHGQVELADEPSDAMVDLLRRVRGAQRKWKDRGVAERLRIIGRVAPLIAQHAEALAGLVVRRSASAGEVLASEVLPLAEALRYVARRGKQVLARRTLSISDRAWWMGSIRVREVREPFGVLLVIGPSNYPLLLPGVQIGQALAAGNAVLIKPAPGCEAALEKFVGLCIEAGVPAELICMLESSPEAAQAAIRAGVDKVLFTGSHETGRAVARSLAETVTPAALELSGNDAVFVLEDADLDRVARCVVLALEMNGGQTCIAPRRLFATRPTMQQLLPRLNAAIEACQPRAVPEKAFLLARGAIEEALAAGAHVACGESPSGELPSGELPSGELPSGESRSMTPIVLAGVVPSLRVAREDIFAPVLSLIEVDDMAAALTASMACRYALGASVFGSPVAANRYAERVLAGCVTVGDAVVPTADARVSFGGWQASGYGVTRGLEGLRELTRLKVICERRGRWLPHLAGDPDSLAPLLRGLLLMRHGRSLGDRWRGCKLLLTCALKVNG